MDISCPTEQPSLSPQMISVAEKEPELQKDLGQEADFSVNMQVEGEAEQELRETEENKEEEVSAGQTLADSFKVFQGLTAETIPRLLAHNSSAFNPAYDELPGGSAFTRGCKFSPDGLCILTSSSDNRLLLWEPGSANVDLFQPCLSMKEGEMVYDFCWYPMMDSSQPDTCCFASTSQYQPIHLYDAFDGHIRATYRCFNHLDEMAAASCVAFDASGQRLYAGLRGEVRIFDVAVPGRKTIDARKIWSKKEGGQAGIVSCIATNPYLSDVYAIGTFSKTVGVYLEPRGQALCVLQGQTGGVTHLQFTQDGSKLLAGGRKDDEILVWDMRNPGTLYCTLQRTVKTNQRIYFDVHPSNSNMVVSGNTDGSVRIWDLSLANPSENDSDPTLSPVWQSKEMHDDCVNGVSFHPRETVLASSSGQRQVPDLSDDDDEVNTSEISRRTECALKVWRFN